jgi:phenylacetate-CoA ligase
MRLADQWRLARQLASAQRSQWWSAGRIRSYQEATLVRMMRHAVTSVPYYRRLGLAAESIRRAEDLERFPVIRKRDVQEEPRAFFSGDYDPADCHASRTSGSSGQPTTTYFDNESWLLTRYALKMRRVAATSGLPLLRRVTIVSEQPEEQLGALARAAPSQLRVFFRLQFLSIHSAAERHITRLEQFRPDVIYAFPSYLLELVETAERRGQALPQVPVLSTSSEVLTLAAKRRIETAFGGRVFDVYGSTEFKEVAWQCRAGRYHLNFESVYAEPQPPERTAPVVLSTLCNRAMPLLRFDVGDTARFAREPCPCGRESPCLEEIAGREGDMIELPSGRRLSPYLLTTAIEAHDLVRTYQIVQTADGAFRVDLAIAGDRPSPEWQHRLRAELAGIIAEPAVVALRFVDTIDRSAGGKRSVFLRAPGADPARHQPLPAPHFVPVD